MLSQIPAGPQREAYKKSDFSGTDDCCWYESELAEFLAEAAKQQG